MESQIKADNRFVVPIGPQHPALKEPGHFEFDVDGEVVTGASIRLGFVHRGIEKLAEQRNYIQDLYLFERICGICSHIHATAFAVAVERLAGPSQCRPTAGRWPSRGSERGARGSSCCHWTGGRPPR